jgi:nicotinic acid mononucleotide adenylyltransferase
LRIIDPLDIQPASVVIIPGAFNPPTRAHVALAHAALESVDAAIFVIPARFPHKEFTGATLDQRLQMLHRITYAHPRMGTALADGGLYVDIAREAREHFPESRIKLVCGRDAAERIVGWTYDKPGTIERMLDDFELLVAAREGHYEPPPHLLSRITRLDIPNLDEFSSTRLKHLLRTGGQWRDLAPDEIADMVEQIYR